MRGALPLFWEAEVATMRRAILPRATNVDTFTRTLAIDVVQFFIQKVSEIALYHLLVEVAAFRRNEGLTF